MGVLNLAKLAVCQIFAKNCIPTNIKIFIRYIVHKFDCIIYYLCLPRLPVPAMSVCYVLSKDGLTSLLVGHGGGEVATEHVVAEEEILKASTDGVAGATDPHRLHHTYASEKTEGCIIIQHIIIELNFIVSASLIIGT